MEYGLIRRNGEVPSLDVRCNPQMRKVLLRKTRKQVVRLSSARVVRCWVKSATAQTLSSVASTLWWGLRRLPQTMWRKAGMTSSHHACMAWATHVLQWLLIEGSEGAIRANPKTESQFQLQAATRLHEAGIASNRRSAYCGEYVPGPCTHRPSHHESHSHPKPVR